MLRLCVACAVLCTSVYAALPFVTDNSYIEKPRQLALETFAENWYLPHQEEAQVKKSQLLSQYASVSYGVSQHLEITVGNMMGYNFNKKALALSNPIFQIKMPVLKSTEDISPDIALSFGYTPKTGMDEYYDPASNLYAIMASTSKIDTQYDKIEINFNIGVKASYKVPTENLYRTHLGVGVEVPLFSNKYHLIAETYNGAPNSPRDSPGYFHSYQVALKFVHSKTLSLYVLYGTQPTFAGYRENTNDMLYRRTKWLQFGIRKEFNLF